MRGMDRWQIILEVWPYSGVEQYLAGDRRRLFFIAANDAGQAMKFAEAIALGIESGPHVWKAPIRAIQHDQYSADSIEAPPKPNLVAETSAIRGEK